MKINMKRECFTIQALSLKFSWSEKSDSENVWKKAFKSHSINNFRRSYITISRLLFFFLLSLSEYLVISFRWLGLPFCPLYYTIASITFAIYLHNIYGISNTISGIKSAHNGASAKPFRLLWRFHNDSFENHTISFYVMVLHIQLAFFGVLCVCSSEPVICTHIIIFGTFHFRNPFW